MATEHCEAYRRSSVIQTKKELPVRGLGTFPVLRNCRPFRAVQTYRGRDLISSFWTHSKPYSITCWVRSETSAYEKNRTGAAALFRVPITTTVTSRKWRTRLHGTSVSRPSWCHDDTPFFSTQGTTEQTNDPSRADTLRRRWRQHGRAIQIVSFDCRTVVH